MKIIGFGGSGHDWSICILDGSEILVAIDEERVSRRKYGIGCNLLESKARSLSLQAFQLTPDDIGFAVACDLVPLPLAAPFRRRLHRIRHHLAHAYSAFWGSPFPSAAIMVVDNSGSPLDTTVSTATDKRMVETLTYWQAQDRQIHLVDEILGEHALSVQTTSDYYQIGQTDNSLGNLYWTISQALGFVHKVQGYGDTSEDGKTMGLASYGTEVYFDELAEHLDLLDGGQFRLKLTTGEFNEHVCHLLSQGTGKSETDFQCRANLARAGQMLLEVALLHCAQYLKQTTNEKYLALAGGVALNCVANARIAREAGFDDVFVFPAAADNGVAVGAALYGLIELAQYDGPLDIYRQLPFLGLPHTAAEVDSAIDYAREHGFSPVSCDDAISFAADQLAMGRIVAWYEGRSEFGPRALGHRSILADPRDAAIKDYLNQVVKGRESFRPFAPMVMAEYTHTCFDVPPGSSLPFMLVTADVRPQYMAQLAAITHVDGTARLQTIDAQRYPTTHRLIEAFNDRTGVPVLLNTSFNRAGEPIVETPLDAMKCFIETQIDALVMEGYVFCRR